MHIDEKIQSCSCKDSRQIDLYYFVPDRSNQIKDAFSRSYLKSNDAIVAVKLHLLPELGL